MRQRWMMGLVALVLSTSPRAHAQVDTSMLRCPAGTVRIGDSTAHVIDACGEPGQRTARPGQVGRAWVMWDVWRYDLGPGSYVEDLTFWNGSLYQIETVSRSSASRPQRIPPPSR